MIKLFNKDLKLFFKDKRSVILTFLLPIALMSLFAMAYGGIGKNNSADPIHLLVSDQDRSELSKDILAGLQNIDGLLLEPKDKAAAIELIKKGSNPAALVISAGLADSVRLGTSLPLELFYDKAREMEVGLVQSIILPAFLSAKGKANRNTLIENSIQKTFPNMDPVLRNNLVQGAIAAQSDSAQLNTGSDLKKTSVVGEERGGNPGLVQAVAGTAILMLLFSVARIGASMLDEKESGTLNRLLYSPVNSSAILMGKMSVAFVIGLLQLVTMFLFSWIVLGLDLFVNLPALILMIIATAFTVSSFGIFLAAISKTRHQALGMSTLIILIMSAVGGSMIPLFIMPAFMRRIAVVTVNYWGMEGFFDIFWRELPLFNILPKILVLLGMGVVMMLISIRLFKKTIIKLV